MEIDAFISYSHATDGRLAPAIQSGLRRFAKPWYRLRALNVFRDKSSLSASPGLWPSIEAALRQSRYFILIAAPEAAASEWVGKEVRWWIDHRSTETLLIALSGGEIAWNTETGDFDWQRTDALPRNLRGGYPVEPLYVDFRWALDRERLSLRDRMFAGAVADLAAPIHGKAKSNLIGEDIRQHRRIRLIAASAVAAITIGAAVAVWQAVVAEQRRKVALARQLAAQAELFIQTPGQLQRGVLLAVESLQRAPTAEGDRALRRGLSILPRPLAEIGPFNGIEDWALSNDGRWVAVAVKGGEIGIWDVQTGKEQNRLMVEGRTTSLSFDATDQILATTGPDQPVELWAWTNRPPTRLHGIDHPGGSRAIAFHPSGNRLSVSGSDGSIAVLAVDGAKIDERSRWHGVAREDTHPQQLTWEEPAPHHRIVISPDGDYLATETPRSSTVAYDTEEGVTGLVLPFGRVPQLWNRRDKKEVPLAPTPSMRAISSPHLSYSSVSFSSDDRWLAVGTLASEGNAPRASIWEVESGRFREDLRHTHDVFAVAFRPSSAWLLTGMEVSGGDSKTGILSIWDWKAGRRLNEVFFDQTISDLRFDSSGRILLVRTGDTFRHDSSHQFDPESELIRTLSMGGEVAILRAGEGGVPSSHRARLYYPRFSVDGQSLKVRSLRDVSVTADADKDIPVWALEFTSGLPHRVAGPSVSWKRVEPGAGISGRTVNASKKGGAVTLIISEPGLPPSVLVHNGYETLGEMRISPNGDHLLVRTWQYENAEDPDEEEAESAYWLWRLPTGRLVQRFPCDHDDEGFDCSFSFSPHRKWLAVVNDIGDLQLWDLTRDLLLFEKEKAYDWAAIDPEGTRLWADHPYYGEFSMSLRHPPLAVAVFDPARKASRRRHLMVAAATSSDGDLVALGQNDGVLQVRHAASGRLVRTIRHDQGLTSVTFSADGTLLATAAGEKSSAVQVFNISGGDAIAGIDLPFRARFIELSPDNRMIAAAGDNQVQVISLSPDRLIADACDRLSRALTLAEWSRFLPTEPRRETCPGLVEKKPYEQR